MRNNYTLSTNLEKKIKQKCSKIIMRDYHTKNTPKMAFLRSAKKLRVGGWDTINKKRGSFQGTIDSMIKNSIKQNRMSLELFSFNTPLHGINSHHRKRKTAPIKKRYNFIGKGQPLPPPSQNQGEISLIEEEEDLGSFDPRAIKTAEIDFDFHDDKLNLERMGEIHESEELNLIKLSPKSNNHVSQDDTVLDTINAKNKRRMSHSRKGSLARDDHSVEYSSEYRKSLVDQHYYDSLLIPTHPENQEHDLVEHLVSKANQKDKIKK